MTITYGALTDSTGIIWYFTSTPTREVQLTTLTPIHPPASFNYYRAIDELAQPWFLTALPTQELALTSVQPGGTSRDIGTGLFLYGLDGRLYRLAVLSTQEVSISLAVAAKLRLIMAWRRC